MLEAPAEPGKLGEFDCAEGAVELDYEEKVLFDGEIGAAFDDDDAVSPIILCPPGSGKTKNTIDRADALLREEVPTVVIVPNKKTLSQFENDFLNLKGIKDLRDLKIHKLQEGTGSVPGNTKVIFTHLHYLKRREFSKLSYSLMEWIAEHNAYVIIDECDKLVEAFTMSLDLEGRFTRIPMNSGGVAYRRHQKCPSRATKRNFKCDTCKANCRTRMRDDRFGNILATQPGMVDEALWNDESQWASLGQRTAVSVAEVVEYPHDSMRLERLQVDSSYLDSRELMVNPEKYKFNAEDTLNDVVNCSYNPTVCIYDTKGFDPAEMVQYFHDLVASGMDEDEARSTVNDLFREQDPESGDLLREFPHHPCGVRKLICVDAFPLRHILNVSRRLVLLTATVTDYQREFFRYCIPNLKEYSITSDTYKPVDNLLIVSYPAGIDFAKDNISVGNLYERLADYSDEWSSTVPTDEGDIIVDKTLVFTDLKAKSADIDKLPVALYDSGERVTVSENLSNKKWKVLESHARGSIARGINLGEFSSLWVDMNLFKPMHSYTFRTSDSAVSGGLLRNLEMESWKVIVVHNCTQTVAGEEIDRSAEILERLKVEFSPLVGGRIETLEFDKGLIPFSAKMRLLNTTRSWIVDHQLHRHDEEMEPSFFEKAWGRTSVKDRGNMTQEQYEGFRVTYRRQLRLEQAVKAAEIAIASNVTWGDYARNNNIYRLDSEDVEYLKSLFV
jgi:hypothetical protein